MSREDELGKILTALSHPLRRRIVKILATRNTMGYAEMLRELGVESSMLSFHLKKLQDLVEKTSDGEYRLTAQGRKAYRVLVLIEGGEPSGRGINLSHRQVVVVSDDLLLEAYRRGGLRIEDAGLVIVEPSVSQSLFRKTVVGIRSIAVYVPVELEGYASAVSVADAIIAYNGKRLPFDPNKPVEAIRDLEKRGYRAVARKLSTLLGIERGHG